MKHSVSFYSQSITKDRFFFFLPKFIKFSAWFVIIFQGPDVQTDFRKGKGSRDQIANIRWIIEKAREFQKNIYFCFIDYAKAFDCVDHNKLWTILKEMGIPDHLTCFLRNLYAGQEATVRTRNGTMGWFKIGKGVYFKTVYCHPDYLNYVQGSSWEILSWMKHKLESRLQGEISITSDMQNLMAESEEEASGWKWKRRLKKADSKLNIQKTKIIAFSPITSWK